MQLTAARLQETQAKWLLMTGQSSAPIELANGLQLRIEPGDKDNIESIVIGVCSLEAARGALADAGLLGECCDGEVSLLKSAGSGLRFRFRQS